jgi:hypothetical protein
VAVLVVVAVEVVVVVIIAAAAAAAACSMFTDATAAEDIQTHIPVRAYKE